MGRAGLHPSPTAVEWSHAQLIDVTGLINLPCLLALAPFGRDRKFLAAAAKAVEAGTTLLPGPEDTPYGWVSDPLDPTGANIRLQGENCEPPA